MALTQVITELDGDVDKAANWPDAFNAAVRARESLDYTPPITAASYDVQVGDHFIPVDLTGNNVTLNLPELTSDIWGRVVRVKVVAVAGGHTCTIDGDASETIDGATTKVLSTLWATAALIAQEDGWLLI